jgi:hypothetical protein
VSVNPAIQPPVNQVFEPASVRNGSPEIKKAYAAALSFEQTLVEQLSKSLVQTSGLGGEESTEGTESSSEDATGGQLSSMLTQSLSTGVMNAGGLGLATQLINERDSANTPATSALTGGSGS